MFILLFKITSVWVCPRSIVSSVSLMEGCFRLRRLYASKVRASSNSPTREIPERPHDPDQLTVRCGPASPHCRLWSDDGQTGNNPQTAKPRWERILDGLRNQAFAPTETIASQLAARMTSCLPTNREQAALGS